MLPKKEQNPQGLHHKYTIRRADGSAVAADSEYFILRLDGRGKDPNHIRACRIAVNAYADAISKDLPKLADDIRKQWPILP